MDDKEITGEGALNLGRSVAEIPGPTSGGLYIGGVPSLIEFSVKSGNMAKTVQGFIGTIKDLSFVDDM